MTTSEPLAVLLDANTLVAAMTRTLLLRAGFYPRSPFAPRWTPRIETEAEAHIAAGRLTVAGLRTSLDWGERVLIDDAPIAEEADLPATDAKDRHVLAAACRAGIRVIVTGNVRDFGLPDLVRCGVCVVHPDLFCSQMIDEDMYRDIVRTWASQRTGEGRTPEALHAMLAAQHPLTFDAMCGIFPGVRPVRRPAAEPRELYRGDRCFVCGAQLNDRESWARGVGSECR